MSRKSILPGGAGPPGRKTKALVMTLCSWSEQEDGQAQVPARGRTRADATTHSAKTRSDPAPQHAGGTAGAAAQEWGVPTFQQSHVGTSSVEC